MPVRAEIVAAALAAVAVLGACEDSPSDLDPEAVRELARTPGDAEGYLRSGFIQVEVNEIDCPCSDDPAFQTLSLCAVADVAGSGAVPPEIRSVQTGGYLVMRVDSFVLSGGIDANGDFEVGQVINLTSVVTDGHIITRAEGGFVENEDGDFELDARIRHRVSGNLFLSAEPNLPQSVECTEELIVTGTLFVP
jgi:hypothetical protein